MTAYDSINVPNFESQAQAHHRYLCSMCGQYTTYNDSASYRGWNLICNHCLYKSSYIFGITVGELILNLQKAGEKEKGEQENAK